MSGTDPSTRRPPPRRFENYVFTRVVDSSVGLTDILDSQFTQLSGLPDYTGFNVGQGTSDDAYSSVTSPFQIGFDFSFDNITYKQFVANVNGWMVLVDPNSGSFSPFEVLISGSSNNTESGVLSPPAWQNPIIRPTFTSNAVLLAPWFDDLRNVANVATQLESSPFNYSTTKVARIAAGLEPPPIFLNQKSYGVSYFHDHRSPKGRRLIVRWSEISNYQMPSSVIKFEVVIYESGTIEYRYTPRLSISKPPVGSQYEGATIGIFMPNGTNRFRDFSVGLGYREGSRQEYVYGGYTYVPGYVDAAGIGNEDYPLNAAYTINLVPYKNWPGLYESGCVVSFSPPVNRRKVLPRLKQRAIDSKISFPLVARTGDSRLGTTLSSFDDRMSPDYVSGTTSPLLVNYPSTLTRFFGGTSIGTLERQDLFTGDFLVTGSIVKSAIEQFIDAGPIDQMPAFNESFRHEQDESTLTSSFYATGSSILYGLDGFDAPLKSKTQVRFSLPVNISVAMPALTSSIYYYNFNAKTWEVPANSTYVLATNGSTPPSPNVGGGGDWANPLIDGNANRIVEDARGFGPIGNLVSSGTHHPQTGVSTDQTDFEIGSQYAHQTVSNVIGKAYSNSVRNNEQYRATANETFTLPINNPFLIEKAVFEIPLAAGPGWFKDLTQCFIPGNTDLAGTSTAFDFAGPALTIALFRQIQLAENMSGPSMRDLILTGTITHQFDNTSSIVLSNFPPLDTIYQLRPVGFLSYAGPAGAVVVPNASNVFTGSVTVETTALSAVGVTVSYVQQFDSGDGPANQAGCADLILNENPIVLSSSAVFPQTTSRNAYVSPIGRGGTGFPQAGRCVLGNEYVTLQGLEDVSGLTATNPFFESSLTAQQLAALNGGGAFECNAAAAIQLVSHFPAPYLVMPGDKFVLSVSKMRPVLYQPHNNIGTPTPNNAFSGSAGHDVVLQTGIINVTLYGSQIQQGVEYHDTLNQPIASNAMHEIIGVDPVLDQFEPAYRHEYSGSFSDNVMLGTLGLQVINGVPTQTVRDRKLSVLNANSAPELTTNFADILIDPTKSYRIVPWSERVGDVRQSQFVDSSERFYDSMMPAIDYCFAQDGAAICIAQFPNADVPSTSPYGNDTFGNPDQVNVAANTGNGTPLGWTIFDMLNLDDVQAGNAPIINANWTKAFPFEPRYNLAARQINVSNGFVATYIYTSGSPPTSVIEPIQVSGLMFGPVRQSSLSIPAVQYPISSSGTPHTGFREEFIGGRFVFSEYTYTTYSSSYGSIPQYYPSKSGNPPTTLLQWLGDVNLLSKNQFNFYTTGSATTDDVSRALYGFGDQNTYFEYLNSDGTTALLGTGHFAEYRNYDRPHPNNIQNHYDNNNYMYSPVIRGWKYGVHSGIPTFSKAYWRQGKFGQFRDMLEQRPYAKYYQSSEKNPNTPNFQKGVGPSVIEVTFVDPSSGKLTDAENTFSSNLNFECTSSLPFFDGVSVNRPTFTVTQLNLNPVLVRHDSLGNIHLA